MQLKQYNNELKNLYSDGVVNIQDIFEKDFLLEMALVHIFLIMIQLKVFL